MHGAEHGVAMLSSVLDSKRAVQMNILLQVRPHSSKGLIT
jgi:hypothetical protein